MLQLQSQNALVAKDSNVLSSKNFACIIGAPVGFTGLIPKTAILGQFWSRHVRPLLSIQPAYFYRAYSGRARISNMYKYMRLHILFREYYMYNFAARWYCEGLCDCQKRKRHINIDNFVWWLLGWGGGFSRPGGHWSNVCVLCAQAKEHNHFCPGAQPGGSVTGVNEGIVYVPNVYMPFLVSW